MRPRQVVPAAMSSLVEGIAYSPAVRAGDFLPTFVAVKREYFADASSLPAWTAVGVEALTTPDYLVELQATAYLGS